MIGKVSPHLKAGRLLNIPRFIAAAIHMTLLFVKHEEGGFHLSWVRPDSFLFKDIHWLDPQSPSGIPPPGLVHPATTTSSSNEENIGENNEEPQPSGGPSTAGRRVPRKDKGKQRAGDVEDAPVAGHKRPREDSDSGGDGDAPPEDESEPENAARGRKAAKRPRGILKNSVDMDTIIDDPKPKLRTAGWYMPEGSVPGRKKAWEKVRVSRHWQSPTFRATDDLISLARSLLEVCRLSVHILWREGPYAVSGMRLLCAQEAQVPARSGCQPHRDSTHRVALCSFRRICSRTSSSQPRTGSHPKDGHDGGPAHPLPFARP